MEISPRRSMSLDLDSLVLSPSGSSYNPTYGNCDEKVYAMSSSRERRIEKPYRMMSSLSVDSGTSKNTISEPRRENFFTTVFGAITSIIAERLGKVPSSFMSNVHNSLSVTVVPNEGIISQEFFRNLTRSCEQLAIEHNKDTIENSRFIEKLKNMCDITSTMSHIIPDDMTKVPLSSKVTLNSEAPSTKISESTKLSKSPLISTEIFNELDVRIPSLDSHNTFPRMIEKLGSSLQNEESPRSEKMVETLASPDEIEEDEKASKSMNERQCNRWQTMWDKVVSGMSERFSAPRALSPDSEVPTKKPNLSKPSRRKTCTIARGRGKGRGKSQLRKNGVSQSRHRKERTKQNIYSNIQDDLNAWENDERIEGSDDDDTSLNQSSIDQVDSMSFEQSDQPSSTLSRHCSTLFENLSFDVASQPRKRKQSLRNTTSNCPTRVRYVPESCMELESDHLSYEIQNNCQSRLRPRLTSESSVDSEDSYCIVFENGSESEYDNYDYDDDDDDDDDSDSETESSSDDDFHDDGNTGMTVRFNLEPEVHTMIKWDYAYRAARRGPWEEMARDRERFRGRIHGIETILTPILSVEHRDKIFENRFDINE